MAYELIDKDYLGFAVLCKNVIGVDRGSLVDVFHRFLLRNRLLLS